jgi:hypothetical protein
LNPFSVPVPYWALGTLKMCAKLGVVAYTCNVLERKEDQEFWASPDKFRETLFQKQNTIMKK